MNLNLADEYNTLTTQLKEAEAVCERIRGAQQYVKTLAEKLNNSAPNTPETADAQPDSGPSSAASEPADKAVA